MDFVPFFNQLVAIVTVAGQIIIIGVLFSLLSKRENAITVWIGKHGISFSFLVALFAMFGSLFYSEIAGYEPCKLCWLQRIFIYPQVFLLGIAFWKKDRGVADYSIVLSTLGAIIAGYHYLLQLGVAPSLPCSAVGLSASCAQRFVMQWGYITIPMMALTVFLLIIVTMVEFKKYYKNNL